MWLEDWSLQADGAHETWRVKLPTDGFDQEIALSVRYWKGAVEVAEETTGEILGRGHLETAGY
jgi:predicted secreted hydrolase